MSYMPQPDSLAGRVCAFFRTHKDEELEARDIATKFDVNANSVSALLASAVNAQVIVRTRDATTWVYKAGPKLDSTAPGACPPPAAAGDAPPSGFKSWLARNGAESAEGASAESIALPDPASIVVEPGVPVPTARQARFAAFSPVFARMTVGDSFVAATPVAKLLITAAARFGKPLSRKYVVRQVDATQSRIWRTE